MEITKTIEENICKLALSGRLDTTTAPELEAELKSCLEGIEGLEFDLSDLEYISSAGLRVLLFAQKSMAGKTMVVRNVKPEIMEVFDITGFSDILTIE